MRGVISKIKPTKMSLVKHLVQQTKPFYGEMNTASLLVFLLEGQNAKQARTE